MNLFPLPPRKEGSVVIVAFLKFRKHSTQGTCFLLVCSENCGFLSANIKPKKSEHPFPGIWPGLNLGLRQSMLQLCMLKVEAQSSGNVEIFGEWQL